MRRHLLALAIATVAACGPSTTTTTTTTPTTTTTEPTGPVIFDWTKFPRVDIVEFYGLISPSYLRDTGTTPATLQEAGVPQAEVEAVLAGNEETAWPAPFTETQRWNSNNIYEMGLIRSRQVAYLPNDQVLVVVLAAENQHLKPGARPEKDFFLVYTQQSLKPIDAVPERKKSAEETLDYTKYATVTIVDPGQIISTPGLREIAGIRDTLLAAGVPEAEHENVYNRGQESGWPYLMSNFDQRIANPEIIKQLVARRVTTVNGMVLLMIVSGENQHMPEGWRPDYDLYAVFLEEGLN